MNINSILIGKISFFMLKNSCWEVHFLSSALFWVTLHSTLFTNFDTGPNHAGGLSVPLKHTVKDISTNMPKNLWVQHWLKFISGNYNVCEAMSSFINDLRHVVRKNPSEYSDLSKKILFLQILPRQQKICG